MSDLPGRLGNWVDGDGPMHLLLARALGRLIDRGELAPGTRLPTERALAKDLAISRTTVVAAYDSLKSRGMLAARQGSGTWVRHRAAGSGAAGAHLPGMLRLGRLQPRPGSDAVIDLAAGVLAPSSAVRRQLLSLVHDDDALDDALHEHPYQPAGLTRLRDVIAKRLSADGVATQRGDLVVTTGAQQALSLVAAAVLMPGDRVVVEAPTHPGALDVWRNAGAPMTSVAVGPHGVDPSATRVALERDRPRALHLTPTFHSPTGSVLPPVAREAIVRAAVATGTTVVEDDALRDLSLDGRRPPPPMACVDPDRTVLVGSVSKTLWAGLRVGWVRAPAELRARIAALKTTVDLGAPVLDQVLAARILQHEADLVSERRHDLADGLAVLCAELESNLPEWRFVRPAGGFSLWVQLPEPVATSFAAAALHHGVSVGPGPAFSPDLLAFEDHLQLAFTQPADVLAEGVSRLSRAWNARRRR